jgi:hypothetical protein
MIKLLVELAGISTAPRRLWSHHWTPDGWIGSNGMVTAAASWNFLKSTGEIFS